MIITMWIKFLYLFSSLTFLVAPLFYKNKRFPMIVFYYNMINRHSYRKLYTRVLTLFLLMFHFYYMTIFRNHYDVIPSSTLCFLMLSHPFCERALHCLQHKRILWAAMVFTLACLFIPHFFPLGYSLGVLVCGAVFYPSRIFQNGLDNFCFGEKPYDRLANLYFEWNLTESDRHKAENFHIRNKRKWNLPEDIEDAEIIETIDEKAKL